MPIVLTKQWLQNTINTPENFLEYQNKLTNFKYFDEMDIIYSWQGIADFCRGQGVDQDYEILGVEVNDNELLFSIRTQFQNYIYAYSFKTGHL